MIKRVPIEPWSTWEKLCLANAVLKAGDQNWNAVSRTVKVIYEDSMQILGHEVRPPHWFSVKQCAAQYELLIQRVIPKRKKRDRNSESADPVHRDAIFNTLKNEYIEELEKKKEEDRSEYARIMKRRDDIIAGVFDDVLDDMWAEELKEKEKDIKLKLKYKLGEKNAERNSSPIKTFTSIPEPGSGMSVASTPPPTSSTSPLLTSLLQSPSQHTLPSSPSISLLLNSTPSIPTNESPTLTKLLESPSSKVPGSLQEQRPRPSDLPRQAALLSPPRPVLPQHAPPPIEENMEVGMKVEKKEESPLQKFQDKENVKKVPRESVSPEVLVEDERPKKKIKTENTSAEIEIRNSVKDIMDRLKEAITEQFFLESNLEEDIEVNSFKVKMEPEDVSKSPPPRASDEEKELTEDNDEVTTGDDASKDFPEEAAASASSNDALPVKVVATDEFNTTDDEPDDNIQIEHNDHEAVEIIMGSNSNSDEESKPEPEEMNEPKDEVKSEQGETLDESLIEVDEDSVSKSPHKEEEEEDQDEEPEEPNATEDTCSSETVETAEPEKKGSTPPPVVIKHATQATPLKEVCITLEAINVQQTYRGGDKESKDDLKVPQLDKIKRSRKKSSNVDSKPSSPASSFNEDEKEYRAWKKSVLLVFSRIASHKYASVFSKPITDAAGYGNWILEPMDLSTIKRNIENGVIRTTLEFQRDVLLMIQNAVIYNAENCLIYNMAKEMWTDVLNEMNVMVQALGDGVPLGASGEGEAAAPTRSGRQAKLSIDKKSAASPVLSTPKRHSRNRL